MKKIEVLVSNNTTEKQRLNDQLLDLLRQPLGLPRPQRTFFASEPVLRMMFAAAPPRIEPPIHIPYPTTTLPLFGWFIGPGDDRDCQLNIGIGPILTEQHGLRRLHLYTPYDRLKSIVPDGKFQAHGIEKMKRLFCSPDGRFIQYVSSSDLNLSFGSMRELGSVFPLSLDCITSNFIAVLNSPDFTRIIIPGARSRREQDIRNRSSQPSDEYVVLDLGAKLRAVYDSYLRLSGEIEPGRAFWVRGHWRFLRAEKWTHKRGEYTWVHPHVRGLGEAAAKPYAMVHSGP